MNSGVEAGAELRAALRRLSELLEAGGGRSTVLAVRNAMECAVKAGLINGYVYGILLELDWDLRMGRVTDTREYAQEFSIAADRL